MEKLYRYFPEKLIDCLEPYSSATGITEIRLRAGNKIQFTENGKIKEINDIYVSPEELDEVFFAMCEYSKNAFEDEISNGFITLENGYRVGIGGEFYYSDVAYKYLLRRLYSLNIRIPQNKVCFGNQKLFFEKEPVSTLIIGPPHSGKTTLIKIYAEYISNNNRLCICDERNEIYLKNLNCDVLKGIKKSTAILMATRTLNPQFIVCDEISGEEAQEILSAVNTGVGFICSAHGRNLEEISRVPGLNMLIKNMVFDRFVILSADNKFNIKEISDV